MRAFHVALAASFHRSRLLALFFWRGIAGWLGPPGRLGVICFGFLRCDEMKDERGGNARPNRQSCALAPISPKTGGNQKNTGQRR